MPDRKPLMVAVVIASQLRHEGRWPPNDLNKVMAADYHYDNNTLALFLTAVGWQLKHGTPSYKFSFDTAFVNQCLGLSVGALIGAVNAKTVQA